MNNDNSLTGVILGAILVIAIIVGVLWYQNEKRSNEEANGDGGALYIGITDATADINNVSEVSMEVKKVEVYSATQGWVTISSDTKTYDLLKLKAEGKTELYAKGNIEAGSYDRVRMTMGNTTIKTKTKGDVKAYSPGNQVVLNMAVNVASGKDTHVKLDILADKSLHTTTDGKFVFAPRVAGESRSNTTVTISNDDAVTTDGGTVDSSIWIGMDLDGTSKTNFELNTNSELKIDATVGGTVKFILGGNTFIGTTVDQEEAKGDNGQEQNELEGPAGIKLEGEGGAKINIQ